MKKHLWFTLYVSFFKISGFTLGGGMVMLPLMEEEFVKKKALITPRQMLDVYAATQGLPGVIAINSSLLIGYWVGGIGGAISGVLGVLTPSVVIITALAEVISRFGSYLMVENAFIGVRSGVTAIMLLLLIKLGRKTIRSWRELLIACLAFIAVEVGGFHPIPVIFAAAVFGGILLKERAS